MKKLPEAIVVHALPGRTRIRIPSRKGDAAYFGVIEKELHGSGLAAGIKTTASTASIFFEPRSGLDRIAEVMRVKGLFEMAPMDPLKKRPVPVSRMIRDGFRSVNGLTISATGGRIDLPTAAFLGLAGWGVYQIALGRFAGPAWYTALWYAMNILLKSTDVKNA